MDTSINPVSGANPQYHPTTAKSVTDTDSVPTSAPAQNVAQPTPSADTSSQSVAQQYETTLRQAALSFKNVYALGDQQFSIFKDVTGKYITRYVSERDGKVTYSPEPTFVKQLNLSGADSTPARIAISA